MFFRVLDSHQESIALACACCKIFESLIAAELLEFLKEHNLISEHQHGFLKRHSTNTNLLECLNDWMLSISNHNLVHIGYKGFQRAFDSISHPELILKLSSYGISGNLLFWIKAFLLNRTHSVRVGSTISHSCDVTRGVPQGSVLDPLLFNLFINDIADLLSNSIKIKMFADDLKSYSELSTDLNSQFQIHLDHISFWATTWQLGISYSKCHILELGSNSIPISYNLNNVVISNSKSITDLGVIIDPNLKFKSHIQDIVNRALLRSSHIFRCFLSRNNGYLVRAFKSYVRPLVEYVSTVWSPSDIGLMHALESVQRRFTKRLPGFSNMSYADRLINLNLQSLEHRRLINDLVMSFKIIHGLVDIDLNDFSTISNNTSLRWHPFKLVVPIARTNVRKHMFSCRIVNV